MNNKDLIIIALLCLAIYLYYQNQKRLPAERIFVGADNSTTQTLLNLLKVNNLEELQTKLGEKTLNELLEERQSLAENLSKVEEQNEDYETEVDTLTRTKNSLEQDLTTQAEAFQSRVREKDREIKKFKEDLTNAEKRADETQKKLTSEKQQHKGSLERISLLTKQVGDLEKNYQEQLRKINCLFDENAKDYETIDFNGLYSLLEKFTKKMPGEFPEDDK